jgi:Fur family ferric uptake transcriptional regulator
MVSELEDTVKALRAKGHRITVPRHWILRVLFEANRHLTCEQLHQRLVEHGIHVDEATVYRTLQWLKQNRIVAQTTLGSGADVYSLLLDDRHHHLICIECGAESNLDDSVFDSLRQRIRADYGFVSFIDHFAIPGLCRACYERRKNAKDTS